MFLAELDSIEKRIPLEHHLFILDANVRTGYEKARRTGRLWEYPAGTPDPTTTTAYLSYNSQATKGLP